MSENFSKVVGIDHDGNPTELIIEPEKTVSPKFSTGDAESDYKKAREIYHKVGEAGKAAITELAHIAKITGEPRAYEVLATIIKSLNETAKQMHEMHGKSSGETNNQTVNVDKAVFVGSQADILKLIRESKKDGSE